ncbi:MAG: DNA primase [Gammaproteobacteria bacterium]
MSRIPDTFIPELLSRVDIVDVVTQYVPLKKQGREFSACCPFHQEKSPSFTVSPQKQFYYCFGCGASGDAIRFLMNHAKLSFVEAVETLATSAGIPVPREGGGEPTKPVISTKLYDLLGNVATLYERNLKGSERAIEYLKKRGLTGQICKRFAVGYAPAGWDTVLKQFPHEHEDLLQTGMITQKDDGKKYDRFRDRIMFPIRDKRGRVIAFGGRVLDKGEPKYLNSPETVLFHKGSQLYGLYECLKLNDKCSNIIVVEGYMDVIAMAQHGISNVVATLGTALTPQHLSLLYQVVSEVIICFDGDKAGRNAALRALEHALPMVSQGRQIKFLFLPSEHDPDSLIREEGKEKFLKRLAQSEHLSSMIIEHLLSQVEISNLDGRARLAELAKPYLDKMSSDVYRSLLLDELARYTRLDTGTLRTTLHVAREAQPVSNKRPRKQTLYERAIGMLLKQPTWAQWVEAPEKLLALNDPQVTLLVSLAQTLQQGGANNTGQLLAMWHDEGEAKYLAELAAIPLMLTEKEAEQEFKGLLGQLCRRLKEMEMTTLQERAKAMGIHGLTDAERQQIREYLTYIDLK